jgi:hypothetical protein
MTSPERSDPSDTLAVMARFQDICRQKIGLKRWASAFEIASRIAAYYTDVFSEDMGSQRIALEYFGFDNIAQLREYTNVAIEYFNQQHSELWQMYFSPERLFPPEPAANTF